VLPFEDLTIDRFATVTITITTLLPQRQRLCLMSACYIVGPECTILFNPTTLRENKKEDLHVYWFGKQGNKFRKFK
jgi:hypothetical protein